MQMAPARPVLPQAEETSKYGRLSQLGPGDKRVVYS
jgi:hypothetical protein